MNQKITNENNDRITMEEVVLLMRMDKVPEKFIVEFLLDPWGIAPAEALMGIEKKVLMMRRALKKYKKGIKARKKNV